MPENAIVSAIEEQHWLEPAAETVQSSVGRLLASGGEAGQVVANALHGTWLGHPLHSAITDVPVGAWTTAVAMDAIADVSGRDELSRASDTAIAIGLVGAVASAAAGIVDWHATDGRARQVGFVHGALNLAGAALFAASLVARRNGSRSAGRGLSTFGYLAVMGSAWLGGKLVYDERIGVDHTAGQEFPNDFTAVLSGDELPEGEMRRAEWNGNRILLARRNGEIYAIAEVCSHLGGPLAEGHFSGCTVQCPWHGSRFSLRDGKVIDGPSVHPQPVLETRVVDGQIEVRQSRKSA